MENPLQFPFARPLLCALLIAACLASHAQAQEPPAKTDTPAAPSPATQAPAGDNSEMSTRDTPPTFRVRVNLVLVRVVVRDASGKVVTNLKKEDFQLSDNRKPQVISTFSAETPESHKVVSTTKPPEPNLEGNESGNSAAAIAALPQRFVAV